MLAAPSQPRPHACFFFGERKLFNCKSADLFIFFFTLARAIFGLCYRVFQLAVSDTSFTSVHVRQLRIWWGTIY